MPWEISILCRFSRTFLPILVVAVGFLFSAISHAQITVGVSPSDTGTVNIAGVTELNSQQNCRDWCYTYSAPDVQGGSATFTASADNGYRFAGWTQDGSSQGSNAVFVIEPDQGMFSETTLVANFEKLASDTDGDDVPDDQDQCPNTPSGESVDSVGCSDSQIDSDGDKVYDDVDQCPNTPSGESVNSAGCSDSQIDSDGDKVYDDVDQCPNTPNGEAVDSYGCSQGQIDGDGDGVANDKDQCPNTPAGESVNSVGCSDSQIDSDGDGVGNDVDQCPNTPAGESVDSAGCSDSQIDNDGDGVYNDGDQCPDTPPGEPVDSVGCPIGNEDDTPADTDWDGVPDDVDLCPYTVPQPGLAIDDSGCAENEVDSDDDGVVDERDQCPGTLPGASVDKRGCSAEQNDADADGVSDEMDQCPLTPEGVQVDAEGCADSQKDTDNDEVDDKTDVCPATPNGESVDEEGCSETQKDADLDGVKNNTDICPETPVGKDVDAQGCADSQRDSDRDRVRDSLDQCPATPVGQEVDESGCSQGQRDDDGDGVVNAEDQCASTDVGKATDENGCSVVQEQIADFGEDLADLEDLSDDDQSVAGAIDDACPRLIAEADEQTLTPGQRDLLEACRSLKDANTTTDQQSAGLESISPQLLTNRVDAVVETASRQFQQVTQRMNRIKSGSSRGVSLAGLTLNFAGEAMPGALLEEAADQAGAGELGPDFGNWGLYLQGDIDVTERRDTDARRQYDEDAWLLTLGADYRFSPELYAGLAISFGETETDYADAQSDTETTALTAYGGWQFSDAGFLDLQLSWADDDYDMSRDVTYLDAGGNFTSSYRGSAGGSHLTAAANLGYMFSISGWRIGPTASYFYLDGEVDGYREEAAGDASKAWELSVGESTFEKSMLRLGLQLDYAWLTDFGVVMPGLILNYVSESNRGDATTGAQLANDVEGFGQLIDIQRETLDGQYWDASFNLAGQFAYGFSGFASYRITAGRDGYQHRGYTLGLRWDQAF